MGIDYPAELEKQIVAGGHQIADWKSLHDEVQAQYTELEAKYNETSGASRREGNSYQRSRWRKRCTAFADVELEQALKQGQTKEKTLSTRERRTALKLIIGMAVKGYCYDPGAERSDKISEIVHDLDHAGVSLDADTVRKWLREAAALLPRESLDDKDR